MHKGENLTGSYAPLDPLLGETVLEERLDGVEARDDCPLPSDTGVPAREEAGLPVDPLLLSWGDPRSLSGEEALLPPWGSHTIESSSRSSSAGGESTSLGDFTDLSITELSLAICVKSSVFLGLFSLLLFLCNSVEAHGMSLGLFSLLHEPVGLFPLLSCLTGLFSLLFFFFLSLTTLFPYISLVISLWVLASKSPMVYILSLVFVPVVN